MLRESIVILLTDASTTVNRGYGDCKDKVNLILSYQNRGIKQRAFPVLVNTEDGEKLDQWLPSPSAFNHAIVLHKNYDDSEVWIDPTVTTKIEDIENQTQPDYGHALILQSQVDDLTPMFYKEQPLRDLTVDEKIDLSENLKGRVSIDFKLIFNALAADYVRNLISQDPARLEQEILNTYRKFYPDINLSEDMEYKLDARTPKVTLQGTLTQSAGNFWKAADNKRYAQVLPVFLSSSFPGLVPDGRVNPYAIPHQIKFKQNTQIIFPFEVKDEIPSIEVEEKYFKFRQDALIAGKKIEYSAQYLSTANGVFPKDFQKFNQTVGTLQDAIGISYSVHYPGIEKETDQNFSIHKYIAYAQQSIAFKLNWSLLIMSCLALLQSLAFLSVLVMHHLITNLK